MIREGDLDTVAHSFRIKNAGEEYLRILNFKNSCGCTTQQPFSENLKLGEEVEIKLNGKRGSTIDTIEPTSPSHVFRIGGTILRPLRIIPQVLDLWVVSAGGVRPKAVNVLSQYMEGDVIP